MTRWLRVDLLSLEFEGERLIVHACDFCMSSVRGAAGVAAAGPRVRPLSPALLADRPRCLMSKVCRHLSSVRRVMKHCWPPGWQSAHSSIAPWAPEENVGDGISDLSWSLVSIWHATCDAITHSLCLCKNPALLTVPKS